MNYRLLHVSITPAFANPDYKVIQARLSDLGRDWLSYNSNSFLLWTDKSTVTVSEMLAGHLQAADQLLVFAVSTSEIPTGRLPHWVWEWINRPRNASTGDILTPALPADDAYNLFAPNNPWLLAATKDQ